MRVDVLVVGGGPAGLTAATELRRLGATVTVAEREREPGGIPRHTEHIGYGVRDQRRFTTGPRYAAGLIDRAERAGVDLRTQATVLTLDGTAGVLATLSGPVEVEAAAVVLATGVRERPRSARLVPGDRPAGVLTTGALQQFAAVRQRVGRRAVVVGAEHVSFSAILTLHYVGCEVAAMVTPLPRHQTYEPLRLATATRHRVPIRTGVEVDEIIGRRRVEAVALSDGSRIECDTVVLTGDWIPDHELARRTGLEMVAASRAPVVDARFRTSQRGVFAIGNLVHPAETADVCALDGRAAASAVKRWLDGDATWPDPVPISVTPPILWAAPTARGITLRVGAFVRGRLVLEADGRTVWISRSRHLVPNRSITIPRPASAAPLHVALITADAVMSAT
jgi:thioredoxin reductase